MSDELFTRIRNVIHNYVANTSGVKRHSAVLIPLIFRDNQLQLLFEVRSQNLKNQPGEICFPGGKIENFESPEDTALRETCEELNLIRDNIQIIGQIDSVLTSFEMLIHCYVGILNCDFDNIEFSKEEVAEIFTVPLDYFLNTQPEIYSASSRFDLSDDFPFHNIPGGKNYNFKTASYPIIFYNYSSHIIWGLTARMIQLLSELIQEEGHKKWTLT